MIINVTSNSDKVLPKYKLITLPTTAGWYRIAKIKNTTLNNANGYGGNNCEIEINRRHLNATYKTEFKKIQLATSQTSSVFINEISYINSSSHKIKHIRHTIDTNTFEGYIEVYYEGLNAVSTSITLSNYRNISGKEWELIEPELTEETVEGVTVLGSHEFSLNKSMESALEWKYLGVASGGGSSNYVTIPINFNELRIVFKSNEYAPRRSVIERDLILDNGATEILVPNGSTGNTSVTIDYPNRKVYFSNSSATSSLKTYVYYR